MTKELLEQYPDICAEIRELEQRMKSPVSDTVSGSGEEYPYLQHPVSIRGIPPGVLEQRDKLRKAKEEIEAFVFSLKNSKERRIVTLRAMQGLSWAQVTAKMGHRYSESGVKHIYYRAIENLK